MIYHMSKEVARNRADTMPALPAVVNAAVAAKYDRADRADAYVDNAGDDRGGADADPGDDDADDDRGGADDDYIYLSPPRILIASSFTKE